MSKEWNYTDWYEWQRKVILEERAEKDEKIRVGENRKGFRWKKSFRS